MGQPEPAPSPFDDAFIFTEEVKVFTTFQNWEFYFSTSWAAPWAGSNRPAVLIEDICAPSLGTSITPSVQAWRKFCAKYTPI